MSLASKQQFQRRSKHLLLTPTFADRQIPTVLSYVDGEEYYGQQAKNFLVRNPENTVAYFKDLLGREYVIALSWTQEQEV